MPVHLLLFHNTGLKQCVSNNTVLPFGKVGVIGAVYRQNQRMRVSQGVLSWIRLAPFVLPVAKMQINGCYLRCVPEHYGFFRVLVDQKRLVV
jgi:hypothetical protein